MAAYRYPLAQDLLDQLENATDAINSQMEEISKLRNEKAKLKEAFEILKEKK